MKDYVKEDDEFLRKERKFSLEEVVCSYIDELFERIDSDAHLKIVDQYWSAFIGDEDKYVFDTKSYDCLMKCTKEDIVEFKKRFLSLLSSLKSIAEYENNNEELTDDLKKIGDKYLKDYDVDDFDLDKIASIELKNYTLYKLKKIRSNLSEEDEKGYLDDDVTISNEETRCVQMFLDCIHQQTVERLGNGYDGEKVIYVCKRICKLFELKSNLFLIANEAKQLAEIMLMNEFAVSREEI